MRPCRFGGLTAIFVTVASLSSARLAATTVPIPETIEIPAGGFIVGSDRAEREVAYRLDEAAYGHSVTREQEWYEVERKRQKLELPGFRITRTLITNAQYVAFVQDSGHRVPDVTVEVWKSYGLVHPYPRACR